MGDRQPFHEGPAPVGSSPLAWMSADRWLGTRAAFPPAPSTSHSLLGLCLLRRNVVMSFSRCKVMSDAVQVLGRDLS